jgi:hypothetical protein
MLRQFLISGSSFTQGSHSPYHKVLYLRRRVKSRNVESTSIKKIMRMTVATSSAFFWPESNTVIIIVSRTVKNDWYATIKTPALYSLGSHSKTASADSFCDIMRKTRVNTRKRKSPIDFFISYFLS